MDALDVLADDFCTFAASDSPLSLMWDGKLEHLAEWDDFSQSAVAGRQAQYLAFATAADALDVGTDPYDIALQSALSQQARACAIGLTWDTELFQVTPKMGMLELCLSFIGDYPLATAEHGDQYLAKLRGMPAALAGLTAAALDAAAQGRVALERHLIATAESVDAYLATPAGPDERLCCQAAPTDLDDVAAATWRDQRDAIVATDVRAGLAAYGTALRELAPRGRPDSQAGLAHLPGGREQYAEFMWANLATDHTADQVHALGLATVEALEGEYLTIAGPLLGTTDIGEIYARLRDDSALKYQAADALVADATAALARAEAAAPAWFARLPVSPCTAHSTDYGAMAYYSTPDLVTGKAAAFYFKTSDPSAWTTYELEAITFHESIPGHHLQFALHAEDTRLHQFQRDYFNTAYAEGWGLYTERLADEMGLYSSELDRVGMLSADSLRACRLVVDTGLHALGWSRDQAIQYMMDHSPMEPAHVEEEVDRYISWPGQALAYMVGRIEIQAIRAEAEARPGFDIREFHDTVLRYGPMPLPTLRQIVLGGE